MANSVTRKEIRAVVPAAGRGARMGGETPKQYLVLDGETILERSVARLRAAAIEQIVVVVPPGDDAWRQLRFAGVPPDFVDGGPTRARSVLNGLRHFALTAPADSWILVHDAVRPCLDPVDVARLIDTVGESEVGGLLAMRVTDTLKRARVGHADGAALVESTEDRSRYWRAQTPQMFRLGVLQSALERALAEQVEITDEAAAVERIGMTPRLVEGRADNIKITARDDLALAAFYLSRQRERARGAVQGEGDRG